LTFLTCASIFCHVSCANQKGTVSNFFYFSFHD